MARVSTAICQNWMEPLDTRMKRIMEKTALMPSVSTMMSLRLRRSAMMPAGSPRMGMAAILEEADEADKEGGVGEFQDDPAKDYQFHPARMEAKQFQQSREGESSC